MAAGLPMSVSLTINKVCLCGLESIALAASGAAASSTSWWRAAGVQTVAPHLLRGACRHKYGSIEVSTAWPGRADRRVDQSAMGELTDRHNSRLGIGAAEQDEFAARSIGGRRRGQGWPAGQRVVGVPVPQRRGEPAIFERRGHPAGDHGRGAERAPRPPPRTAPSPPRPPHSLRRGLPAWWCRLTRPRAWRARAGHVGAHGTVAAAAPHSGRSHRARSSVPWTRTAQHRRPGPGGVDEAFAAVAIQ